MTVRQMYEKTGREYRIDDYFPPVEYQYLIDAFWKIRSFCLQDEPMKPGLVREYCLDRGVLLNRDERGILYRTDAEFRAALNKKRRDNDRYMARK